MVFSTFSTKVNLIWCDECSNKVGPLKSDCRSLFQIYSLLKVGKESKEDLQVSLSQEIYQITEVKVS